MLRATFHRHPRTCTRLVLRRSLSKLSSTIRTEPPGQPFDILFFGRDEFSCMLLQQLYDACDVWQKIHIATQPDMRAARPDSDVLPVSPLKTLGKKLRLPVHELPSDEPSFERWQVPSVFSPARPRPLTNRTPLQPPPPFRTRPPPPPTRLLVTAAFGPILPTGLLRKFAPGRRLNVHPSLLPMYRGPAPIQHALLDGQTETGVCVIEMAEAEEEGAVGSGDVWGRARVPVPRGTDFRTLQSTLAAQGGELLVSVLRNMINGTAEARHQLDDFNTRRAPAITPRDALVRFSTMTAQDVVRRHRAISHQAGPAPARHAPSRLTRRTVRLHAPAAYEPPPRSLLHRLSDPGMAWYDPLTDMLAIRCAADTLLVVPELKTQEDLSPVPAKAWWNSVRHEITVRGGDGQAVLRLLS
ncbi:uncharacterized protein PHACADRAFT_193099 [Phanerochaete carnosa HHB-10118-sp]|uniref:Formyl transferase N-terminal domain-containing protein n=1 Tax=Phanerochaete carnosa (strain HHB-10118-sp) TaxID=650164 RepID=K5V5M7_PHACS|nr:uncharacterized protein PHACADRAFT_193099 [Phanerochaete carnosa HHB-10118-sp]EKM57971.1 hypothetical protein PHACADRAFT_193099 [Phanerochaete carnosa HHB-10118-sp]